MAEYITKAEALHAVEDAVELFRSEYDEVAEKINNVPAADVAPVVHGQWDIMGGAKTRCICSKCRWDVPEYGKFYSYCPNCGAKMEGDTENETNRRR